MKNIKAILISRFQYADFIGDSSKQEAIDKIKNLKNIEIALNGDILPKILKTSKVMNLFIYATIIMIAFFKSPFRTGNVFHMARQMNLFNFNLKVRLATIGEKRFEDYEDDNLLQEIHATQTSIGEF